MTLAEVTAAPPDAYMRRGTIASGDDTQADFGEFAASFG